MARFTALIGRTRDLARDDLAPECTFAGHAARAGRRPFDDDWAAILGGLARLDLFQPLHGLSDFDNPYSFLRRAACQRLNNPQRFYHIPRAAPRR